MKRRSRLRFVLEGIEGVVLLAAALCTWPVSKRWWDNWGAHAEELERVWPGDGLASPDRETHTRGIDIGVPSAVVWPWIVQLGLRKAGFYSYELLERLVGIPLTNIESIEPAMQSLAIGDEILLHPKASGIPVVLLEAGRYVCFGRARGSESADSRTEPARSWSIYLEAGTTDSCRLIVRGCIDRVRDPSVSERLARALEPAVDFVMEQRMLRTVKRLAEATIRGQAMERRVSHR